MCSYCGCESESVIAELMADHETVGMLVYHASTAAAASDTDSAVAACRQISDLFARHGRKEELGIFTELRAGGLALDAVEDLERDHGRLAAGLALLASGDLAALGAVLADLIEHADREDTDLFPAALHLLPNDAWGRIDRVHRAIRRPEGSGPRLVPLSEPSSGP